MINQIHIFNYNQEIYYLKHVGRLILQVRIFRLTGDPISILVTSRVKIGLVRSITILFFFLL
jgi:hypothetical protein